MKKFVVGFLIDENNELLTILKNRPEWQAGQFNGIGGHIEEGEAPLDAMIRELKEETNVTFKDWEFIGTLKGVDYILYIYGGFYPEAFQGEMTMTDEVVSKIPFNDLNDFPLLPSARWMIAMLNDPNARNLTIQYNEK